MKQPSLLIMAAGMGSRYGGLKQLDEAGPSGETIMEYSIHDAIKAGFRKVIFIVRDSFLEDFKRVFGKKLENRIETIYVTQELNKIPGNFAVHKDRLKPWGTGHAVYVAKNFINEPFAVINADDFYGRESFFQMYDFLKKDCNPNNYALIGYNLKNTLSDHGSVSRGVCNIDEKNFLENINERQKIQKDNDEIIWIDHKMEKHILLPNSLVSMNFLGFHESIFNHLSIQFSDFLNKHSMELTSEIFIPAVMNTLLLQNKVNIKVLKSKSQWFGITYKEDKKYVTDSIQKLVEEKTYPRNLWD